jgi:hypothetical protein
LECGGEVLRVPHGDKQLLGGFVVFLGNVLAKRLEMLVEVSQKVVG